MFTPDYYHPVYISPRSSAVDHHPRVSRPRTPASVAVSVSTPDRMKWVDKNHSYIH